MERKKLKKVIRKELRNHFGHANLAKIRKLLKEKAVKQYGCYYSEIKTANGLKLSYTSNPNCFAKYLIGWGKFGSYNQYGLAKKDITKAGKERGCDNPSHYIF
jgi:cytochrome oxidase Cu insertion factor (SCO1/SenC/PrrC family)